MTYKTWISDGIQIGITGYHYTQGIEGLKGIVDVPEPSVRTVHQIHSATVVDSDLQIEAESRGDALRTSTIGRTLMVKVADCAGIVLYDKRRAALAVVHSGWRGTSQRIVAKAIAQLVEFNGASIHTLCAWISPAACQDCYEVGEEFAELFPAYTARNEATDKLHFNNVSAIVDQLQSAGIVRDHIVVDNHCTIHSGDYHSYRREGAGAGRNFVFATILE